MQIAEVFGFAIEDPSKEASESRQRKWCPFRNQPCNKGSIANPLGICSFTDGQQAGTVCPSRFLEQDTIFHDIGRMAFGPDTSILVVPEMKILRVPGAGSRKIGKVDYIVARLTNNEDVCDFAALEVQSVYFSGKTVRPVLDDYLRTGLVAESSERRLDYRSSAQKRLIPQLSLKVPVFRRWGKKFFVAVDDLFYDHLPISKTVNTLANSEVTWVVYPFSKTRTRFTMGRPRVVFTLWEDVLTALREGQEPTPEEIISQISEKKAAYRSLRV